MEVERFESLEQETMESKSVLDFAWRPVKSCQTSIPSLSLLLSSDEAVKPNPSDHDTHASSTMCPTAGHSPVSQSLPFFFLFFFRLGLGMSPQQCDNLSNLFWQLSQIHPCFWVFFGRLMTYYFMPSSELTPVKIPESFSQASPGTPVDPRASQVEGVGELDRDAAAVVVLASNKPTYRQLQVPPTSTSDHPFAFKQCFRSN